MSPNFGKFEPPASGYPPPTQVVAHDPRAAWSAPIDAAAPAAGSWMAGPATAEAPTGGGHPVGGVSGGHIDGMGDYLRLLLQADERVVASISLKGGDVAVTDERILVQSRTENLVSTRATYAIRRSSAVSVALASVTYQMRILVGFGLMASGLYAASTAGQVGGPSEPVALTAGLICIVFGLILALTSRSVALLFDAGPDRVAVRVRSTERARVDRFFQQVAGVVRC